MKTARASSAWSALPELSPAYCRSHPIGRSRGYHPRGRRILRVLHPDYNDSLYASADEHPRAWIQTCATSLTSLIARERDGIREKGHVDARGSCAQQPLILVDFDDGRCGDEAADDDDADQQSRDEGERRIDGGEDERRDRRADSRSHQHPERGAEAFAISG